jgi:hypothetical protein
MTKTEYAQHRGVSVRRVTQYQEQGLAVQFADGSFDPAGSDARINSRIVPRKGYKAKPGTRKPEPGVYNLAEERAKREHFAALREEIRVQHERGLLLDRKEVEDVMVTTITRYRKRMERLADRVAAQCHAAATEREVHGIIHQECWEALSQVMDELSQYLDPATLTEAQ